MRRTSGAKPPTDDKRWRIIEATMRRSGFQAEALIETLHAIQSTFGYLEDDYLAYVSQALPVSPSKVYGVATFYHFFQLKPQGDHVCSVCTGTACYIKGAKALLNEMEATYGVTDGETSEDGRLSVLSVRCIGACGLAPAIILDGEVVGNLTMEEFREKMAATIPPVTQEVTT